MTAENLWISILSEVRQKATSKLPSNKSLLVIGDNGSGKTTVIAKLQGVEDPKKGSGLEYAFIDVRDEYRDDHTRLGAWILDGDTTLSYLLKFALSEETYADTTIMFVVSMTTPWNILDQLQTWAAILQDHIDKLKISSHDLEEYRNKCIRRWNEYVEHGDDIDVDGNFKRASRNLEDDQDIMQLGEEILTRNLGLDVVVVVTKTDYMVTLEKDHDYRDEHFDFIQQWIRKFCLNYGAALFYTSAKEDKNCDLLYKYLTHRIYGLPFQAPALIVEKDAVFIPSGWDNIKKISILYENLVSMKQDDYYRNIISPPVTARKNVVREVEITAEDEQTFLQRQYELLQGANNTGGLPKLDISRSSPGVQKTGDRRLSNSPSIQTQLSSAKKIDPNKSGSSNPNEGVLASFFNSLLHKKIGSPRGANDSTASLGNLSSSPSSLRTDAAAELDKLAARKSFNTSTPLSTKEPASSTQPRNPSPDLQNSFSEC
ncbi:hypothetical protein V9T40_011052 [Parthenolecanium corni]|uniref:Dynein light intermediate chain n=1 Tax=Parthenolecanium corni TaxID=536013 RepID=A0AAN9T6A7_9HEMI